MADLPATGGRLNGLPGTFDLIVIGGGSTGAATLREATRAGLKALLVERRDFASGTSSRSTRLAQGGLRYLDTADVALVRESTKERARLASEAPGLAKRLPFTCIVRKQDGLKGWKMRLGVSAYVLLAGGRPSPAAGPEELATFIPGLEPQEGMAGLAYEEAPIDDARLVLRLLADAQDHGATALNYASVLNVQGGETCSVRIRDELTGEERSFTARAVVSATGVCASGVPGVSGVPKLRPLRGSHLHFSKERLPLMRGISFRHPRDRRFVCALPWEDVVVVGTTEHDHKEPLDLSPAISDEEVVYLLEAAAHAFPKLGLTRADVVSTVAGVRPIVDTATAKASDASREHHVYAADGVVTITGGKLTTCRAMARDALEALEGRLPELKRLHETDAFFDTPAPLPATLSSSDRERLSGRYGPRAAAVISVAKDGELEHIAGTSTLWAELRHALRSEAVVHLDDLLLRRTRVGVFLSHGGEAILGRVEAICREELGWDAARWTQEADAYRATWKREHGVPEAQVVPLETPRTSASARWGAEFRTVDAGGPVHYAEFGGRNAAGPTLVLLHGVGGCWQNWLPSAPMLAESARVLAVDLVGYGRTPRADRSQGMQGQLEMVERFLDAAVGGPAILMGNSLGGLLALAVAAREPKRVAGLVLVSPAQPPVSVLDVDPELMLRGALHVIPGIGELAMWNDGRRTGARGMFLELLSLGCVDVKRVPADVVDANVEIIEERMKALSHGHMSSYFDSTRSLVATLALPGTFQKWVEGVKAPTLLVQGDGDRLVPVACSRALSKRRPDWTYAELAGLGHVPQMEDAATFVRTVEGWLKSVRSAAA